MTELNASMSNPYDVLDYVVGDEQANQVLDALTAAGFVVVRAEGIPQGATLERQWVMCTTGRIWQEATGHAGMCPDCIPVYRVVSDE